MNNRLLTKTKILLEDLEEFDRQITLIEQPFELQIQIDQDGHEAFIDLTVRETKILILNLLKFVKNRT